MPVVVQQGCVIPDYEISFTTSRSGGPGGQHVNRTESRVTLWWSPASSSALSPAQKRRVLSRLGRRLNADGLLHINVDTHRSQLRNRREAELRLAELLGDALHVRKRRRATKPTRGSVERRLKSKRQNSEKKRSRRQNTED